MNKLIAWEERTRKFSNLKIGHIYLMAEGNSPLKDCTAVLYMGRAVEHEYFHPEEETKGFLFLELGSHYIYDECDNSDLTKDSLIKYVKKEIVKIRHETWLNYKIVNRYTQIHQFSMFVGEIENVYFTEEEIKEFVSYNRLLKYIGNDSLNRVDRNLKARVSELNLKTDKLVNYVEANKILSALKGVYKIPNDPHINVIEEWNLDYKVAFKRGENRILKLLKSLEGVFSYTKDAFHIGTMMVTYDDDTLNRRRNVYSGETKFYIYKGHIYSVKAEKNMRGRHKYSYITKELDGYNNIYYFNTEQKLADVLEGFRVYLQQKKMIL
ncbi:hypothetical protein D3C81_07810 [compost metagenome]